MTLRPALAIALLALLASAPAAGAATEARVLTSVIAYDAPATQQGELAMFFLLQSALQQTGLPWFDLAAARVDAVQWEQEYDEANVAGLGPQTMATDPAAHPTTLEDAHLVLQSFQGGFEVHVFTVDGTLPYQLESTGGQIQSDAPRMGSGATGPSAVGNQVRDGRPDGDGFSLVARDGEWVVHTSQAPRVGLHTRGDFVVEMRGFTLADPAHPDDRLESGMWTTPLANGAPPQTQDRAYHVRRAFLRLTVTDGALDLGTEAGQPSVYWAAGQVASTHSGAVTLKDAVWGSDGVAQTRSVVPANSVLDIRPEGSRLDVGVSEAPSPQGTVAHVAAPASAALVGSGAVLALAAAVGVGVLRRVLRLPALADVERAIEEGHYRKAARLAARILGRLPGSEEALLGRAIALSKDGRPDVVVAELSRHLAERPASDGTLHYVLGLAQLQVGRDEEGQRSLREAVRLTPSLQAEVAPRLGKPFSPPSPTPRETHGYA
jgi:hypothetical protein